VKILGKTWVKGHWVNRNGERFWREGHYRSTEHTSSETIKKSLFKDPDYKKYSNIIEMDDVKSAKRSVRTLQEEFDKAETQNKKRRIAHVTQLAANRSSAMLDRKNLSQNERDQFHDIGAVYQKAAKDLWQQYSKQYS
jgi:hypothetical protein